MKLKRQLEALDKKIPNMVRAANILHADLMSISRTSSRMSAVVAGMRGQRYISTKVPAECSKLHDKQKDALEGAAQLHKSRSSKALGSARDSLLSQLEVAV